MGQKKLKICPLESTFIVDFKNVSHDHVPLGLKKKCLFPVADRPYFYFFFLSSLKKRGKIEENHFVDIPDYTF